MTSGAALTKSSVNRAGEALAAAFTKGVELPLDACESVAKWRELHAEPLVWLTMSVRGRVGSGVSYRLKRLPQIAAKLARAGNMALARMQDVGGCRNADRCIGLRGPRERYPRLRQAGRSGAMADRLVGEGQRARPVPADRSYERVFYHLGTTAARHGRRPGGRTAEGLRNRDVTVASTS